jgi:hypothetical protein
MLKNIFELFEHFQENLFCTSQLCLTAEALYIQAMLA